MTRQSRFSGKPWWQIPSLASRGREVKSPDGAPARVPGKGDYDGACQRVPCENRNAHWFNATNGRYYCEPCARALNAVCKRNGQDPLCELHPPLHPG